MPRLVAGWALLTLGLVTFCSGAVTGSAGASGFGGWLAGYLVATLGLTLLLFGRRKPPESNREGPVPRE